MPRPVLAAEELTRAWQITRVIGRYGLVPLADALGVAPLVGRRWGRQRREPHAIPLPMRLRLTLQDLGTTFIKLGQVLSARSDLLPPEFVHELANLHDQVPSRPFSEMAPVFEDAFGQPPQTLFATFDPTPVASASIGQAYAATLTDGTAVIVKIQRPGIERQVAIDLALLMRLARLLHTHPRWARYDFPALVREFGSLLNDELIYTLEAHNAEGLAREMQGHPEIGLPQVIWPLTARHVLTTERIFGAKITDLPALAAAGLDTPRLARLLATSLLEQILLFGLFHGDPHPGNILVTPAGTIAFIDTGIVGRLDRATRETLLELAIAIFEQDIDAVLGHLQQLGVAGEETDVPALRLDLARLITKYYFLPRRELRLGELLERINHLLFVHHIRMAYEFGLVAKALLLVEGIAEKLDPAFDYNEAARPVLAELRRQYFTPTAIWADTVREMRGLRRQLIDLPRRASLVLTRLERGSARVRLVDEGQDAREAAHLRLAHMLIVAMLLAGVLVASALVLLAAVPASVKLGATILLTAAGVVALGWMLHLLTNRE
jgi:ubiquinone biosynthesis protein